VILLNGRFLQQPVTGVQRFAHEIVGALDWVLGERDLRARMLAPPGSLTPAYQSIDVQCVGRRGGQIWEQIDLPRHANGDLLLNLGNVAPLLRRSQAVVLHDAGIYAVAHSYTRTMRAWYRLQHLVLRRPDVRLLTVSEFSRSELAARLGVPASRISVLTEGCDHIHRVVPDTRILERHGLKDRPFALAVGSLAPHKNFAALGKTAAMLSAIGAELVVAGRINPKLFAAKTGLPPPSATYLGGVSDGELRALYESATVFIFPSLYEGFGLPALEAMLCGCPTVVSGTSSLPEICGDAALYCDPTDPEDIAQKVCMVVTSPDVAATLRIKGKERAGRFTWRRSAETLLDVLG
jgi:glycosyltransferase involved in cell wall biosynthesis